MFRCLFLTTCTAIVLALLATSTFAQPRPALSDTVRAQFLGAWNAYRTHAWGHDELRPLTRKPHDWYGRSLCMTPVDAYDGMLLIGLTREAGEAKQLILDSLSFDLDIEVQSFEITIRLLGGLLSAYQPDGDRRLLVRAEDLGRRLIPVFNSATGMPYRYVNLRTGRIRDSLNNPAEIGTSLLEFGTLSRLTGNPVYYDKSKNALVQLFNRRSAIGLVGTVINVETGAWLDTTSHIGGMIDSYYEYLFKAWKLFGDPDCKRMWDASVAAVNRYLADTTTSALWYGQAGMNSGVRTGTRFGALEAFFPGLLAYSGDLSRAARLEESCYRMWNLHGIEPEELDYAAMKSVSRHYYLRPEIIESAFYLHRVTGDVRYLVMGETFLHSLMRWCRVNGAYAELRDVATREKADAMQSFFFAETLKYLWLLFAPPGALSLDTVVFNTEAHPLRKSW